MTMAEMANSEVEAVGNVRFLVQAISAQRRSLSHARSETKEIYAKMSFD